MMGTLWYSLEQQTPTQFSEAQPPPERLLETEVNVLHPVDVLRGCWPLSVLPKYRVQLHLAPPLYLGVGGQQVEGEGHVGGRRVVACMVTLW